MWSVDEVGRKGGGRDEKQQCFLQGRKGQRDVGGGKYRSVLVKVFVQRARVSVCICGCNLEVLLIEVCAFQEKHYFTSALAAVQAVCEPRFKLKTKEEE